MTKLDYSKTSITKFMSKDELLTIDKVKQDILTFEKSCEAKGEIDSVSAELYWNQLRQEFLLEYTMFIKGDFATAKSIINYLNSLYESHGVFHGAQVLNSFPVYEGTKKTIGYQINVYTMISEDWLKQHWPEYLEKFEDGE